MEIEQNLSPFSFVFLLFFSIYLVYFIYKYTSNEEIKQGIQTGRFK